LHKVVLAVATAVIRRPGSSPQQFGTAVHTVFAAAVRSMNLPGIGRTGVEQSFDKGGLAKYGQDGSIRTDVVLRNAKGVILPFTILRLETRSSPHREPRSFAR